MKTIKRDVVGAFLFSSDGHILLGKNVKGGVYEDFWVVPGGGVDDGESKEDAVKREVLEEVGIDISAADIKALDVVQTGIAEKTVKDTGERVMVDMTFYDYIVTIDSAAADIPIILEDDFGYAEWLPLEALNGRSYSPSVERTLRSLSLLS